MKNRKSFDYAKFGYIFSIPFVVAWLIFSLYPTLYTIYIGFTDLAGAGASEAHLLPNVFQNYIDLITDNAMFKTAFFNTFLIWGCNFVPQLILALLITAWFTDESNKIKFQGFFKVVFYLPNIITAATIAILFASLFGYPKGPVNDVCIWISTVIHKVAPRMCDFLRLDQYTAFDFSGSKFWARAIVIFIQTWMWYGYTSVILISGVLGISPELFEAASVDGANTWQKFWKITIPNIKTILLFTLVTSLIGGMQMFDIPYCFLGGKPDNATLTTSMFIYNKAFGPKCLYNQSSAASMIMFVIILVCSAIMFYFLRDKDEIEMRRIQKEQENLRKAAAKAAKKM